MKGFIYPCERDPKACLLQCGHCFNKIPRNQFESKDFGAFWDGIEQGWAEQVKFDLYYEEDFEDPDLQTCPYCGLVGSCMCDEMDDDYPDDELDSYW